MWEGCEEWTRLDALNLYLSLLSSFDYLHILNSTHICNAVVECRSNEIND